MPALHAAQVHCVLHIYIIWYIYIYVCVCVYRAARRPHLAILPAARVPLKRDARPTRGTGAPRCLYYVS